MVQIDAQFLNRDGSLSRRKVRLAMGTRAKARKYKTKRHSYKGNRAQKDPRARIQLQQAIDRLMKGGKLR